jgi:hypothetical protein
MSTSWLNWKHWGPRASAACTLVNGLVIAGVTSTSPADAQVTDPDFPVTNARVFAMALHEGILYIGGDFTRVGKAVGGAVRVDASTGNAASTFPKVIGEVHCIEPDGSGGWFLGGSFSSVGGVPRENLAHVNSDGAVTDWNPGVMGGVEEIVVHGSLLYLRGSFTAIGGEERSDLAAVRASDGVVMAWAPVPGGDVNAMAVGDSAVYIGGDFYWWGSEFRNHLVALDPTSGALLPWDPQVSAEVEALCLDGATLYVGGRFWEVAGVSRQGLAALDVSTGAVLSWNPPGPWLDVRRLSASGATLFVAAHYTLEGATFEAGLSALSLSSGSVDWRVSTDRGVVDFVALGASVYVVGDFTVLGGQPRYRAGAVERTTGEVTTWDPDPDDYAFAVAGWGSDVAMGGRFNSLRPSRRERLAAIDVTTGLLTDWDPSSNGRVIALTALGQTVYAGGEFSTINGQVRVRIAAIDAVSGICTPWNPGVNSVVGCLDWFGSDLIVAGDFTSIGGVSRRGAASIDPLTAEVRPWNPRVEGSVRALSILDSTVYVGGFFSVAGGQPRFRIAALDAVSGVATPWNPGGTDFIQSLVTTDSTVIVGGSFSSFGGVARKYLAAIDRASGQVTSWYPNPNSIVSALALSGSNVLLGGQFNNVAGVGRSGIAEVDANTGALGSWNPRAEWPVITSIMADGSVVYVGGTFRGMGGEPQSNLAAIHALETEITVQSVSVTEGDAGSSTAAFTVMLSRTSTEAIRVDYMTEDGTATSGGGDYQNRHGTIEFQPGEVSRMIEVPIHGDTLREDDETFAFRLSNAVGAQIRTSVVSCTIMDDDLYRGGLVRLFRAWSDPGDAVGLGGRYFAAAPEGEFTVGGQKETARLIANWDGHVGDVTLVAPQGELLAIGEYRDGARAPFQSPGQPGLNARIDNRHCAGALTSFDVREIRVGEAGEVTAFWATFEQHCDGVLPGLRGEIVYDVDIALLVQAPQYLFSVVSHPVSFAVTVIDAQGDPVSLEAGNLPPGATFMDNGDNTGLFNWPSGALLPDTFVVAVTATDGSGYSSTSTTEIRIGGPDFVAFEGDSGDFVTGGNRYLFNEGNASFERWSSGYGAVSVRPTSFYDQFHLAFAAPMPWGLTPGRFVADLRPNPAAIGLSGNSRGCNFSRGSFDVRQIEYGPNGEVERFWAVFERVCMDVGETWTRGEVRLNADTSLYVLPPADAFMTAGSDTTVHVYARDTRGFPVEISMVAVPPGAVFEDQGGGVGVLRWESVPATPETLSVHFVATSASGAVVSAPSRLHVAMVDSPTPVLVSVVTAKATAEAVHLEWHSLLNAAEGLVERRQGSDGWSLVGESERTGSDRYTFVDDSIQAGARYAYRLELRISDNRLVMSPETWIEIPAGQFSLERIRPNPVTGPLAVEFTLPRAATTTLSIIDVTGRSVLARTLGEMHAGKHTVPLVPVEPLAPGVYWIELAHGGESRTQRIVVTR